MRSTVNTLIRGSNPLDALFKLTIQMGNKGIKGIN